MSEKEQEHHRKLVNGANSQNGTRISDSLLNDGLLKASTAPVRSCPELHVSPASHFPPCSSNLFSAGTAHEFCKQASKRLERADSVPVPAPRRMRREAKARFSFPVRAASAGCLIGRAKRRPEAASAISAAWRAAGQEMPRAPCFFTCPPHWTIASRDDSRSPAAPRLPSTPSTKTNR